jgi:hypothetical protein
VAKIVLYGAALEQLLNTLGGPVGRRVDLLAQRVATHARDNAAVIVPATRNFPDFISVRVQQVAGELEAIVHTDDGKIAKYLAAKEEREHVWFGPALTDALHEFGMV